MNRLNLADNLVRLRHEKKVTQEQLADFVGVTKASVSKWETRQSTPDIALLPQLASYFDVTIDDLVGYSPQLSKEQIRRLYQEFAEDFASRPFAEAMAKTKRYVKQYYSCYPFLFQISVLWLNHYTLAAEKETQEEVLRDISGLCDRIRENCSVISLCSDATALGAFTRLQLGQAQEVIDALEDVLEPFRLLRQSDNVLIMAYMMNNNQDKAESFSQMTMYSSLLSLVNASRVYLSMHADQPDICQKTIERTEAVINAFSLITLNPNGTAQFEYQAALCCLAQNEKESALDHTERYVSSIQELFSSETLMLRSDDYFTRIGECFEQLDSGADAPRSRKLVLEDVCHSLSHPAFSALEGEPKFEHLKNRLKEIR